MKRKLLPIITAILLTSCTNTNDSKYLYENYNTNYSEEVDYFDLEIVSPVGAPSIAFYNEVSNENFKTYSQASSILPLMTNEGPDIVVVDIISGLNMIKNGSNYSLASVLTFGNFYLTATGNDSNSLLDKDDYVVVFNKNGLPDKLFSYIYGNDYNVHYVASVSDASNCLITGKNINDNNNEVDYVLMAEPLLTNSLNNKDGATYSKSSIYANLQELYSEKSNSSLVQAGLFINNNSNIDKINKYLNKLENDINILISNPSILNSAFEGLSKADVKTKYGLNYELVINILNKANTLGLGYKLAINYKENIKKFLEISNIEDIEL